MKESFWTYLLIVLGIAVIVIMILVQDLTGTSEADYYLTKEVMEAAMVDSIDYGTYAATGDIRIIESKFVENFTRRFSESVTPNKTYTLEFYEIYENPPKATVRVKTSTGEYSVTTDSSVDFDIVTTLSGILETKYNNHHVTLTLHGAETEGANIANVDEGGNATFKVKPYSDKRGTYTTEGAKVTCDNGAGASFSNNIVYVSNVTKNTRCVLTLKKSAS